MLGLRIFDGYVGNSVCQITCEKYVRVVHKKEEEEELLYLFIEESSIETLNSEMAKFGFLIVL